LGKKIEEKIRKQKMGKGKWKWKGGNAKLSLQFIGESCGQGLTFIVLS